MQRTQKRTHIYVELSHFAVQQKVTQHCKSTGLQISKTRGKKEKESQWPFPRDREDQGTEKDTPPLPVGDPRWWSERPGICFNSVRSFYSHKCLAETELHDPCPLSRWCHPTLSSSVIPFSSRLQSFPSSRSFPMSQLFASGGQSIGVSASTSVLSMNSQDWFPLGWTGWISLQSKGLSRVFSNTTVQNYQFFGAQLSL